MNAPFYVEVLARNGEVRHRQRVEALPIRIGRGYDNEFILDDLHASPQHALVEIGEDGGLQVRDLDSRNGVIFKGRRRNQLSLDGDTVFRLGHTNLRVRSADFAVVDARRDTTSHGWEGWPPALAGLALMVLLTLVSAWGEDTEKSGAIHYVNALVGMLAIALVWVGGWTLANRLFGGQTRFGRHLFIAACGLIAIEAVSLVCSVAAYSLSLEILTKFDSQLMIAAMAGMVYFHLLTINPNHPKRIAFASALVALLGAGVVLMVNYQKSGLFADELYISDLYSPALRLSADKPVNQFLDAAGRLKPAIDAERGKAVNGDDESPE
ncbi:MAG: FHA domain-containing protein [Sideroxydans sp.]|nr:FHA domain-containing protein [Sideroxydans sp.]